MQLRHNFRLAMAMATTAPPAFQPKLLRLDNDSFDVVAQGVKCFIF